MESMLHEFNSKELAMKEKEESLIYVCYERSLYHYFRRNLNTKNFCWLFADRYYGFSYSDGNEPIQPVYNGLSKVIGSIQEVITIDSNDLYSVMKEKFSKGYKAYGMLTIKKPDGSIYTTSTLFEGMLDNTLYYTKTGRTNSVTCIPIEFNKFLSQLPKNDDGKVDIIFIRANDDLLDKLNCSGIKLYNTIMKDLYGFYYEDNSIKLKNKPDLKLTNNDGIEKLIVYFKTHKDELIHEEISKKNQLRMHRHIANKIEPVLYAWNSIIFNTECRNIIGCEVAELIFNISNEIENNLEALLKWASMIFSRPSIKYMNLYISELTKLNENFNRYQKYVNSANYMLLQYEI